MKSLRFKRTLLAAFIALAANCELWALDGAAVTVRADGYLSHDWICNTRNARHEVDLGITIVSNIDDKLQNNDWRYPFFPPGAANGWADGNTTTAQTGTVVGMAYCMSHRDHHGELADDSVDFDELLAISSPSPTYQAGQIAEYHQREFYTGIDCSGLVANCLEVPLLVSPPWDPNEGVRS